MNFLSFLPKCVNHVVNKSNFSPSRPNFKITTSKLFLQQSTYHKVDQVNNMVKGIFKNKIKCFSKRLKLGLNSSPHMNSTCIQFLYDLLMFWKTKTPNSSHHLQRKITIKLMHSCNLVACLCAWVLFDFVWCVISLKPLKKIGMEKPSS